MSAARRSRAPGPWARAQIVVGLCLALIAPASAQTEGEERRYGAPPPDIAARLDRLVAAYPDHLARHDGVTLFWRDGTGTPISDGRTDKTYEELLADPDIDDMFAFDYPTGPIEPAREDPGRVRNEAFFAKMYGDCRETPSPLVAVAWTPGGVETVRATSVNGVAERLGRIAAALEALPAELKAFAAPSAGAFNCRAIAGTDRLSAHSYGAAIDLAVAKADYWRWAMKGDALPAWRNKFPSEIVAIFEREGFIWGGRWRRFDTMHFEYRPELFAASPR